MLTIAAAAARAHARQDGADHRRQAEEIGLELGADRRVLALLDRAHVAVAGVVDQHVDAAEGALGFLDGGGDRVGIGDVELQRDRLAVFALDEIGDRLRIAGGGDEAEAVRQGGAGEFAAQPGRAAGDEPDRRVG